MKIEKNALLDQQVQNESPFAKAKAVPSFSETAKAKADALDQAVRVGQTGYDKKELQGKSAVEEIQQAADGQMSAKDRKNQMAMLANTMTPEEYKRAQEEGFSLRSTESGTIVTVTDKIKAELAKAGVDISHMGGALTKEQIEEIGGSLAAVNRLEKCLHDASLPATEENMTEGLAAIKQAEELAPLSEGAIKYMLDNQLSPSIANLYRAEFSGSGQFVPSEDAIDVDALRGQMEQVIAAAGMEVNEQTLADGAWMIQNGIAFTAENFSYMQKLGGIAFPIEEADLAKAIAQSVAEGGRPEDAMLLPEYTLQAQAEHAVSVVTEASDEDIAYLAANRMELTIENLEQTAALRKQGMLDMTAADAAMEAAGSGPAVMEEGLAFLKAKRMLEETRLAMTTEANRALLKQGISIDTKPLEELVEKLKEQEHGYYDALLKKNGETADASAVRLFEETSQKVSDLKQMPAVLLGMRGYDLSTVNGLHEAGTAAKQAFDKAGETYEALMTAPRKDMGDSIQKAFSNVDDILEDLGMEPGEANRRAVRILAYNSLDITEESILTMKAADERVQRTFSNLTPAAVREMIQQGSNPLDLDLDALNQLAEAIRAEQGEADTERFSEYLWKLDQRNGISPEERASFVGIYRLMQQVEKTDGAAIGALVSQGAKLTMRNLLTAVRSAKKSGMDYQVDDDFGGVDADRLPGGSITDQIETAYQRDCMKDVMETMTPVAMQRLLEEPNWENYTPEQLKQALYSYAEELAGQETELTDAYAKEQLKAFDQAAASEEAVYRFLERYDLPNTVDHVLAAQRFLNRRNQIFSQMFDKDRVFSGEPVDLGAVQEEILRRFGEALKTPKEMAAAQETLAETAENVMKTMIKDAEHITEMDLRELKLMNTQISIAGKMAKDEEYTIPVLVGGEVTNLSLKIVRGTKKKGVVEIMFETNRAGKVAASIEAKENGASGFVAVERPEAKRLFEAHRSEIAKGFGEEEGDLQIVLVSNLNFSRFAPKDVAGHGEAEEQDAMYEVQTARLYKIAKDFIEHIKELEF